MADIAERATLRGHTNWVLDVAFSPDGRYIVSGSENGAVHLWSSSPEPNSLVAPEIATFRGHPEAVTNVAWSPTSALIASGCTSLGLWVPPA